MKVLPKIAAGVAKRILKLRIARGLNQTEFGARVGVSQGYIAMLEKGDRKPSQALLIAMAVKFSFNENYMRTGRHKQITAEWL